MCAVSMIYDHARDHWPQPWQPLPAPFPYSPLPAVPAPYTGPTKEQFEELLKLIRAAKRFDEVTGQKDCEDPAKAQLIRDLAKHLGVELPADFGK